jgi:WASH complex subunit strumpellin
MDDVYNQIRHYPNPEHRSRALSQQAGYLYVLLYFVPDVLHDETAVMREIVDKHFVDNWVVPFVTGHCVDLSLDWHLYQVRGVSYTLFVKLNKTIDQGWFGI